MGIPRRLVLVLAVACGISVANLYYSQPLLSAIAHSLKVSSSEAGLLVTVTQAGYVIGLIFVVPLGDAVRRRGLVLLLLAVSCVCLLGAAAAPDLPLLGLALLLTGVTSTVAQVLVPFAATLAAEEERGRVVGTVMSGLLLGILLARTVAGLLAQLLGWRAVFVVAAGAVLLLIALIRAEVPDLAPEAGVSYSRLLTSVGSLLREHPVLRLRCLLGALGFACFSIFWTTLAFLLAGPPFHYGEAVIGLFGLAGAAGAVAASQAGRLADRGFARLTTVGFAAAIAVSFLVLLPGAHHLLPLLAGVVVLDLGVQGLHITNQSEVYALDARARGRLTTAYMTSYFAGGTVGSVGGSAAWSAHGWDGVCLVGGVVGLVTVLVALAALRGARPDRAAAPMPSAVSTAAG